MLRPSAQFYEIVLNYMGEILCFLEGSCLFRQSLDNQCLCSSILFTYVSQNFVTVCYSILNEYRVSNFLSYFSVVPIAGVPEKFINSSVLLFKICF